MEPHALFGWGFSSNFVTPTVVTSIPGISGWGLGPVGGRTSVFVLEKTDEYWLLRMYALLCGSEISTPSDFKPQVYGGCQRAKTFVKQTSAQ